MDNVIFEEFKKKICSYGFVAQLHFKHCIFLFPPKKIKISVWILFFIYVLYPICSESGTDHFCPKFQSLPVYSNSPKLKSSIDRLSTLKDSIQYGSSKFKQFFENFIKLVLVQQFSKVCKFNLRHRNLSVAVVM